MVSQTITLAGTAHYGQRIPPALCGSILHALPFAITASVRMAFEGRSTASGRKPSWLPAIADIRFVALEGDKDTVLRFEAPTLGEGAEELYRQGEFWSSRPDPGLTGFDLLAGVVKHVGRQKADSDRFDARLLDRVVRLGRPLNGKIQQLFISGAKPRDVHAVLDARLIEQARMLYNTTPSPRRVRLAGVLDMLRVSTSTFAIKLFDGQEVRGTIDIELVDKLRQLLRERVVISGYAVYRPTGALLRIDADDVHVARGDVEIWSHVPSPNGQRLDLRTLRAPQRPRTGVGAIIGQWPGDETEEEVFDALEKLS